MSTCILKLSADLIQRRDDLRQLLGDQYASVVADYRAVLRGLTLEDGRPMAEVCIHQAKKMEAAGHDPNMWFAALVEECGA